MAEVEWNHKREKLARETLRATPHDPSHNCGREGVVFAQCDCDRHIRAMLAFADQERKVGGASAGRDALVEQVIAALEPFASAAKVVTGGFRMLTYSDLTRARDALAAIRTSAAARDEA